MLRLQSICLLIGWIESSFYWGSFFPWSFKAITWSLQSMKKLSQIAARLKNWGERRLSLFSWGFLQKNWSTRPSQIGPPYSRPNRWSLFSHVVSVRKTETRYIVKTKVGQTKTDYNATMGAGWVTKFERLVWSLYSHMLSVRIFWFFEKSEKAKQIFKLARLQGWPCGSLRLYKGIFLNIFLFVLSTTRTYSSWYSYRAESVVNKRTVTRQIETYTQFWQILTNIKLH